MTHYFKVTNDRGHWEATIGVEKPSGIYIRMGFAKYCSGKLADCVARATVSHYDDGSFSISPRRKNGRCCLSRGNLLTYWAKPVTPITR